MPRKAFWIVPSTRKRQYDKQNTLRVRRINKGRHRVAGNFEISIYRWIVRSRWSLLKPAEQEKDSMSSKYYRGLTTKPKRLVLLCPLTLLELVDQWTIWLQTDNWLASLYATIWYHQGIKCMIQAMLWYVLAFASWHSRTQEDQTAQQNQNLLPTVYGARTRTFSEHCAVI